jgi:hypothetical protein
MVTDKDGNTVWKLNAKWDVPRNPWRAKGGSWSVDGGTVIVKDAYNNVVKAYRLKPGETVEGID